MTISGETDQVFKGVSGDVVIDDAGNNKKLTVSNTDGWTDTVIWNPYGDAGKREAFCVRVCGCVCVCFAARGSHPPPCLPFNVLRVVGQPPLRGHLARAGMCPARAGGSAGRW